MNPETEPSFDAAQLLRDAFIRVCSLNDEAIAKIEHAARVLDISFTEAAISTGFATEEDVAYAIQSLNNALQPVVPKAHPSPVLDLKRDPFDGRTERLQTLRTELLLRHDGLTRANMVAMLSPCPQEGRSRLCAELAMSFAQLGHPTLLVDADLRNPSQHVLFNADNELGLSQAIAKRAMPQMTSVEGVPCLSLLTAGSRPLNPLELLSDGHFERLIHEWRHSYEFVVIDTAPVSRFSDGLAVATLVGRVLLLSRADHTPYRDQKEMLRRLTATRANVLGAVISHF
jgi:protein-tyrosine kinase